MTSKSETLNGRTVDERLMKSLYQILGVSCHDHEAQIKTAYRRLVKELHPDLHPNDAGIAERFKDVSRAYAILSDPAQRNSYDRGEIDVNGARLHPFTRRQRKRDRAANAAKCARFHPAQNPGSYVFESFFGNRRNTSPNNSRSSCDDHSYEITVSFFEAARGISRRLSLRNGKTVDLLVPPGTEDGQSLRLRAQGKPAIAGSVAGDAIVKVRVKPHGYLVQDGTDVRLTLPVSIATARSGGKIRVPTLDGAVTMTLPKGAKAGTILRLKGKGIVRHGARVRGDQYVRIEIDESVVGADSTLAG